MFHKDEMTYSVLVIVGEDAWAEDAEVLEGKIGLSWGQAIEAKKNYEKMFPSDFSNIHIEIHAENVVPM